MDPNVDHPTDPNFAHTTTQRYAYVLPLDAEIDSVLATVSAFQRVGGQPTDRIEAIPLPLTGHAHVEQELATLLPPDAEPKPDPTYLVYPSTATRHHHRGSAFSALPTRTRWAIRYQGSITRQQWELLLSPWKLDDHHFQRQLAWCDTVNQHRARRLTRRERYKLNRARRAADTANQPYKSPQ